MYSYIHCTLILYVSDLDKLLHTFKFIETLGLLLENVIHVDASCQLAILVCLLFGPTIPTCFSKLLILILKQICTEFTYYSFHNHNIVIQ